MINVKIGKDSEKERILESIKNILATNTLLTLSTFDNKKKQPHSSTAYYCFDGDLNLYFWTDPNAKHSKNIAKNSNVAVNIFDSSQEWDCLKKGLQSHGVASVVKMKELLIGGASYMKRFPGVLKYVTRTLDFHAKRFQSKLYKIEINWIKLFDEEMFGKEEWREIVIKK